MFYLLASTTTHLKDGAVLPPRDLLLKFMVESSTDEKAPCANCDSFVSEFTNMMMTYIPLLYSLNSTAFFIYSYAIPL